MRESGVTQAGDTLPQLDHQMSRRLLVLPQMGIGKVDELGHSDAE